MDVGKMPIRQDITTLDGKVNEDTRFGFVIREERGIPAIDWSDCVNEEIDLFERLPAEKGFVLGKYKYGLKLEQLKMKQIISGWTISGQVLPAEVTEISLSTNGLQTAVAEAPFFNMSWWLEYSAEMGCWMVTCSFYNGTKIVEIKLDGENYADTRS